SPPPARPRRARRRARRGAAESCRLAERDLDVALEVFLGERPGDVLADDPPLCVDEPRLWESRHPVVPECRAVLVADDRIRDPRPVDKSLGIDVEVLCIDAENDYALVLVAVPGRLEERRLVLARATPGSPEVE